MPSTAARANEGSGSPSSSSARYRDRWRAMWWPTRPRRPRSAPPLPGTAMGKMHSRRGSGDARRTAAFVRLEVPVKAPELPDQQVPQEEFLPQPDRDRHPEGAKASRRKRKIGFEQTLELEQRLVIENDKFELIEAFARLVQAVIDGVAGKPRIVLLAGEALLLCCCDHLAVMHDCGRAVVVVRRDPQDPHTACLRRVCR